MYELTFGITDAPFRLTPDPAFYFHGEGHSVALAEIHCGLAQIGGFTVLTGEIGVGKTTVVRTLTNDLVSKGLVVGELVSTQLSAEELPFAVAHAFGVVADKESVDGTARLFIDFLVRLGADGRRAVLFIDEAHNLHPDTLVPLDALATPLATQRFPLQVCLVGQPELRSLVASVQLKNRIHRSFHLLPLDLREVRAYVEHRLRTANWDGTPSFDDEAFAEIFRWTGGVPRRINLLCSRLLLSRFLDTSSHVSVDTVAESARELLAEIGGPERTSANVVDLMTSTSIHQEGEVAVPEPTTPPSTGVDAQQRMVDIDALPAHALAVTPRPLLCVVAGEGDFLDAAALFEAMARQATVGPLLMLRVFRAGRERYTLAAPNESSRGVRTLDLDLGTSPIRVHGGELRTSFIAVCEEAKPCAVVVFQSTDASVVCAIAARQRRIPVISVGPAARERRQQRLRDEMAKKIWSALHGVQDFRP